MNSSIERHLPKTAPDAEKEAQAPGLGIYAALVGLYVAQAIPLYLVAAALPPILRANGINLAVIGGLGMLMLPWVLKALWAPWIDRVAHNPAVGRKGVVAVAQVMIFALICVLATLDPVADIALFFPLLMAMSLASATQDIAADGYAVEHLPPEWQARGSAIQSGSIAVGVLIGGSLTLFLYDLVGWQISVMAAGCASIFALCGFFLIPESHGKRTQSQPTHIPKLRAFAAQPAALSIFGFALIFRLPEGLIKSLEQSFLVDSGFSLTTIGILSGGSAAFVGLFGTFIGMIAIRRFGLWSFFAFFIALRSLIFARLRPRCAIWLARGHTDRPIASQYVQPIHGSRWPFRSVYACGVADPGRDGLYDFVERKPLCLHGWINDRGYLGGAFGIRICILAGLRIVRDHRPCRTSTTQGVNRQLSGCSTRCRRMIGQ